MQTLNSLVTHFSLSSSTLLSLRFMAYSVAFLGSLLGLFGVASVCWTVTSILWKRNLLPWMIPSKKPVKDLAGVKVSSMPVALPPNHSAQELGVLVNIKHAS